MSVVSALVRLKPEDHMSEASLGYIARPSLQKQNKTKPPHSCYTLLAEAEQRFTQIHYEETQILPLKKCQGCFVKKNKKEKQNDVFK